MPPSPIWNNAVSFNGIRARKYNLHPVVRGVTLGRMAAEDRERHGQRVIDYFSAQTHRPYEEVETLEDVRNGLHVVRTLLKLGHFQRAADAYQGDLANALAFNLEAYAEDLSLLRPFFPAGWGEPPKDVTAHIASYLAGNAAFTLYYCRENSAALAALGVALQIDAADEDWAGMATKLRNVSHNLIVQNRLAEALRVNAFALDIATLNEDEESIFNCRRVLFSNQSRLGRWREAAATWRLLDPMGRAWSRAAYRPGNAEWNHAQFLFWQGTLQEEPLAEAERLAAEGKDRRLIRELHRLRGDWMLEQGEWKLAAASYQESVRLARERSLPDASSETGLALAKHHLGQLAAPLGEAERLSQLNHPEGRRRLAQLWLALGDPTKARHHALAAYAWAWAEGEPFVHRYELTRTTELLRQMDIPIPDLPSYDPAKDVRFPWEDLVVASIRNLRLSGTGAPTATVLASQWMDFLEGAREERPKHKLELGFPTVRVVALRLRNITVFDDTGTVEFGNNDAMLLGDNATGKSTILKCIALASIGLESANEVIEGSAPDYLRNGTEWGAIEVVFELCISPDWEQEKPRFVTGLRIDISTDRFSVLSNSDLTLRGRSEHKNCIERFTVLRRMRDFSFGFACAYGSERNFNGNSLAIEPEHSISENDWVLSLFRKQAPLLNPDTLIRLMRGDTRNFPNAPESLAPELITDIAASINGLLPNAEITQSSSAYDVKIRGTDAKLSSLSDGYSSVLAFVGHVARAALRHLEWVQNPFLVSGILLIDELDVHLHPAWQTHVFSDLRRVFPNLQILASTHSPLVVGALDTKSVFLLEAQDGKTSVVPLRAVLMETQTMKAWRADQILTGPGFNLQTSISREAQEWENEFEKLYSISPERRRPQEERRLAELKEKLNAEIPRAAESPITREAASLFEEWALSRLKRRRPEEIAVLVNEAKELLKLGTQG